MNNEFLFNFIRTIHFDELKLFLIRRLLTYMLVSFLFIMFPLTHLHAAEPDNIKINGDKRSLVIASSNNFPPINSLDDKGQLIGFARDMSSAVAKAIGAEVTYMHSGIWPDVLKWLATGKADLIHDTGYNIERESYLDFTDPIIEMPESIFVRNQQYNINNLSSLYGKKVACVNRHITHIYLQKFKEIQCYLVNTPSEGLIALIRGDVEAFIYPEQIVFYLAQQLKFLEKIKVTGEPLRVLSWSMTVKDGNKEVLKQLNRGITAVKDSGEYQIIYNKWFGKKLFSGYSKTEVTIIIISSVLISLLFALVIGFFLYSRKTKMANNILAESESKYRTLADKLPQSIFLKDVNSNYISCNQQYADSIGIKPNDIVGKNDYDFHPEHAKEYRDGDKLIMESGETHEFVESYIEAGKTLYIHTTKTPVYSDNGAIKGVLGIFLDITEQKNLQKQLLQSQKMESIGQLTGGIAHDFNNILASILGYSELAISNFANESGTNLNKYLTEIHHAGERGRDLVADMLAFGRTTPGEVRSVNPELIISEVLQLLKPTLPSSVFINVNIASELPFIMADPVQMHQVITNLVINAYHAIGEHGKIELTLHAPHYLEGVCNSCHKHFAGEFIEISIHDNGPGIPKDNIEHIFEPFFTTKVVGKGSGLGLSVVHGILHKCNGHILVESEKNTGTNFRLILQPSITGTEHYEVADDNSEMTAPAVENKCIMVVDDEPGISSFVTELLNINGYKVQAFNDPLAALKCFTSDPNSIDLLITDQTMPKLTGAELAEKLISLNPKLPVILCTGYSENINEEKSHQLGIAAFIKKPVVTSKLLDLVATLLRSDQYGHEL